MTQKPPAATCPSIDRAQRALRRLKWRVGRPDDGSAQAILVEGLQYLEDVRAQNAEMRAAFYEMRARLRKYEPGA